MEMQLRRESIANKQSHSLRNSVFHDQELNTCSFLLDGFSSSAMCSSCTRICNPQSWLDVVVPFGGRLEELDRVWAENVTRAHLPEQPGCTGT